MGRMIHSPAESGMPALKTLSISFDPDARRLRAHDYRLRAEMLRVISEDVTLAETQRILLGIAQGYDEMAATLEITFSS